MQRSLKDDLETVEHLIKQYQRRMTAWELDFIDNVYDQLTSGRPLYGRQGKTLDDIWAVMMEEAK